MKKTNFKKRWIGFAAVSVCCLVIGLCMPACSHEAEEAVLKSETTEEKSETVRAEETSAAPAEEKKTISKDKPTSVPVKEEQKKDKPFHSPYGKTDPKQAGDSEEKPGQTGEAKKMEEPEKTAEPEKVEEQKTDGIESMDTENIDVQEKPEDPVPVEEPETSDPTPEPVEEEHHHAYYVAGETAPTCTSAGKRTYACSCGLTYDDPISMLDHAWAPVADSVHHEAEVKPAWDETVSEAWDEPVYESHSICNGCGIDLDVLEQNGTDRDDHIWDEHEGMNGWHDEKVQVDTIHHEAETVHHPEEVISRAWDEEVVTGYRCSVCGTVR